MSALFEELDFQPSPIGDISLRRRRILSLDRDVWEVKLGDAFLMSSLFTAGEEALATLALARTPGERLEVLVGGLGLGCTAHAALVDARVAALTVVEYLPPVIDWHRRGLVPLGRALAGDPRCRFVAGDFFALMAGDGVDGRRFDAVLLDIDHSPEALLSGAHAGFYTPAGLAGLARWLKPGGVFGMWSDALPEAGFTAALRAVFADVEARVVAFDNPLGGAKADCTIYLGRKPDEP
jgi:spermidine synthase